MFGFPTDLFGMGSRNHRQSGGNALVPQSFFGDSFMMPSPFGGFDNFFGGEFGMNSSPFAMMDRMMRASDSLFSGNNMSTNGPVHSFTSTTVMSYNGTDGRPKVYHESKSHRRGPGGLEETRQAVQDSERGINKVHIGHRIGDRKHVIEREMNAATGQISENVELENLDEEEAEHFKKEWRERSAHAGLGRRTHHPYHHRQLPSGRLHHPSSQQAQPQLAIEYNSSNGQPSHRHNQRSSKYANHSSQRSQSYQPDTIDLTGDTPRIEEIEQSPIVQQPSVKRKASSSSSNDADVQRKHRQNRF